MIQKLILFTTVIFCARFNLVSAQSKEVRFLIDTCITILKKNSANRGTVNWKKIEKNALAKAAGINNAYMLGPAIRYMYESVNDFHGTFFYKDSAFKIAHRQTPVSDSIQKEWNRGISIQTKMLDQDIGYLRIPYMSTGTRQQNDIKTQNLNDSLCSLFERNCSGLVIDLRLNGGGDMHLMILGVAQLLGEGIIGSFHTKEKENWILRDNSFFADSTEIVHITPKCNTYGQNIPIVLLTSPGTGSSGEFFVMAFKGRKNTIVLGDKTAGYVTVIAGFPINNVAQMNISVGYGVDRNGKIYKNAIDPDIPFKSPDSFNDINNDEKVKAAMKWIKLHPATHSSTWP